MKYLVVIAIEEYQDPLMKRVAWAQNDADAVVKAFELHGYQKAGHYIHRNEDATKTAIESRLRRLAKQLTADDDLVFYYAGHGFSESGHNVLSAWDTQYSDIEHTSIRLSTLLEQLRESECKRIQLFLDACHTGLPVDSSGRGIHTELSEAELEDFFRTSEYCLAFTACRTDEKSYSSGKLKHGIWTYHVIEAICGRAKLALDKYNRVTSISLQNYLKRQVPRTIAETFTDGRQQNPWMFGGADGEFVVADVGPILEALATKPTSEARPLPRVTFFGEASLKVKSLSGFKPTHRVPKTVDSWTQDWVEKIGAEDVKAEIEEAYANIRDTMGYTRLDLKKGYTGGSSGTIVTPDFDYNVSLSQDPESSGDALIHREVTHIRNPAAVLSDKFQETFPRAFDTIRYSSIADIKIQDVVDQLERDEPDGIELLGYDEECTYCNLRIEGISGTIKMTADDVEIVTPGWKPARELAQLFATTWNKLLPSTPPGMLQLPGEEKKP